MSICWHLITSVYRAQGLACPWEGFNGAYLNKWNHTYRKKNWWFVTVSFGIRETAKLKSISTRFSLLVSDTTPVSETFFSNSRVVKRGPFSTFITRSASEVFYLLATVSSHSVFPVLHLENCIRFQDITVSEPLWASERGVVKPHCDDCTGKQWYTRPARPQTEGRRTHKHGPRLKCLCPPDQGTWNRYLKPITLLERGCMRWTAYKSNN